MKLKAVRYAEVTLDVDGLALVEYEDDDDGRSTDVLGVKYVEAKSGSNFLVRVNVDPSQIRTSDSRDSISIKVFLDGKYACGKIKELQKSRSFVCDVLGIQESNSGYTVLKRFKFANLTTSDEPVPKLQRPDFKSLGEITVVLHWVHWTLQPGESSTFKPLFSGNLSEKCLKGRALSCITAVGEPELVQPRGAAKSTYPYGKQPFAEFIFKYRSRKDLQIEGVLSRDPSPIPLEDRDVDDLSFEEMRERLRRGECADRERLVKIKREKRDLSSLVGEDDEDQDRVKTIDTSSRHKRPRKSAHSGVEIIDLSKDD